MILLIFLLLNSNRINAQSTYSVNWFTDSEGLPQNSIKDIALDRYGYVWLSSENGLARYDGSKFKIFNTENIQGIGSNRMRFLEGNMQTDSLFTFDNQNQLVLIHKGIAKRINDSIYSPGNFITDNPDYINTNRMIGGYHFIPENLYLQLYKHNGGYFSIGKDTIREYDKNRDLKNHKLFPITSTSQFFLFDNRLHVLDDNNKFISFNEDGVSNKYPDKKLGNDITVYSNDVNHQTFLYSHTQKALYLIESITDTIKTRLVFEDFDLKSKMIISVCYDTQNRILYLGSLSSGLFVVKKNYFNNIHTNPGGNDNVEYAMAALNDSTVLTAFGGIVINNKLTDKWDIKDQTDKYGILKDRNDNIWSIKGSTLYKFSKGNDYEVADSITFGSRIMTLFLDQKDILWVGTDTHYKITGGIFSLDITTEKPIPKKHLDIYFKISCISTNYDGKYLIGGWDGLYSFDPDKEKKSLKKIDSLGTANIRSLYRTGKDIWVTTYDKGFFLYNKEKTVAFPHDENNYLATAHCIIEDRKGFFWITTNKGLFQVSKQSLYDYANGKIDIPYYHYYDKNSGFLTNEFNGGCYPCGIMLPNDQIYVPSLDGVVSFNASEIKPVLPKGTVYFDEIEMDGTKQFMEDGLEIGQDVERITFYISSPNYGHTNNNNIEVTLDGSSGQQWNRINEKQTISYTNLPPGKHTLTARKLAGFNSDYTYKSITFFIPPAFWQTLWFKLLVCTLLLATIYLSIRIRTRYIHYKNILLQKKIAEHTIQLKNIIGSLRKTKDDLSTQIKNQKRLIRTITHDIKSPLKYLTITSQHIYINPNDSDEELKENIKSIYTSSFQLYHFVNNILDYSKAFLNTNEPNIEEFNLYHLVNDKVSLFHNITRSKRILVINNIHSDFVIKLNKQLFSIIIHNLLDNAVKNTYHGKIVFDYFVENEKIYFSITDTGIGMEPDLVAYYQALGDNNEQEIKNRKIKGLGLKVIIEIIMVLNGNIIIDSTSEGTKITLSFDIK
ncbi:ATP-binding protein [Galbibacter sp. EGI 63066]|uniref:ligand-binding sensor domain-containing protein n=1 Tax=Galbibacter sp. EGI 63066 TaxID=2993559 RepID=UPI002248B0E5|nr:sensor histidine kinase [Galbibacter sp. EGI 63066]MCX2678693.1 ATP-binding protein [Galbibacter sp. EGI 63066]